MKLLTRRLDEKEFKAAFGTKMLDVTDKVFDPIDIWSYVKSIPFVD
jgi:hypothetical protein